MPLKTASMMWSSEPGTIFASHPIDLLHLCFKEAGVGLGLLAIYLLVLLSPLHQAAGLQRQLDALGFASLETWSICGQLAGSDEEDSIVVVKCAASGIGKNEVAPNVTTQAPVRLLSTAHKTLYWRQALTQHAYPPKYAGQPRGPPFRSDCICGQAAFV